MILLSKLIVLITRREAREKMSQRPSRHQRRASQIVFVLPENFSVVNEEGTFVESTEQKPAFGRSPKPTSAVAINEEKSELMKDAFGKNITA